MSYSLPDEVLTVARRYAAIKGLSMARVSTLASNSGRTLAHIDGGGNITVGRCQRMLQWFSDNWPPYSEWPEEVTRPLKKERAA